MTLERVTLVRVRRAERLMRAHEAACETLCGAWTEGGPFTGHAGGATPGRLGHDLVSFSTAWWWERRGPCTWSTFPVMHLSVRSASDGIVVALRMKNAVLKRLV